MHIKNNIKLKHYLSHLGFTLSAITLWPYLILTLFYEPFSFSRWPIIPVLFALVILLLLFFSGLEKKLSFKWKHKLIILFFSSFFFTLTAIIWMLFFYFSIFFCKLSFIFKKNKTSNPSIRKQTISLLILLLFIFPVMNAMYFMGVFPSQFHFQYPQNNIFYQINKQGFRGPNISIHKEKRLRFLFIGDSTTFGFPYEYQYSYPYLFQKYLPKKLRDVDVINAGTIGYNITNIYTQLPYYLTYNPDVAFIMTGYHFKKSSFLKTKLNALKKENIDYNFHFNFNPPMILEMLRLGYTAQHAITLKLIPESQFTKNGNLIKEKKVFLEYFEKILSNLKEKHIETYVLEYPTVNLDIISNEMKDLTQKYQAHYIPLQHMLFEKIKTAPNDPVHPDKEGHRMIATVIIQVFLNLSTKI